MAVGVAEDVELVGERLLEGVELIEVDVLEDLELVILGADALEVTACGRHY